MIENIFDIICSCLLSRENQDVFLKAEGVDLMIRMLKYFISKIFLNNREKNFCARPAIKTLSYALDKHPGNCKAFIEGLGLKYIFPTFMRKGIKEKRPEYQKEMDENIVAIIFSLFVNSTGVSLDRVVNKFKENDSEKIDRVIELYHQYVKQLKGIAQRGDDPEFEGMDPEVFL